MKPPHGAVKQLVLKKHQTIARLLSQSNHCSLREKKHRSFYDHFEQQKVRQG